MHARLERNRERAQAPAFCCGPQIYSSPCGCRAVNNLCAVVEGLHSLLCKSETQKAGSLPEAADSCT